MGMHWGSWLRHCATSRKVEGSIPDGSTGIFRWHNPSGRTVALGSTQPLREMSTRNIFLGGKGGRCVGLITLPPSCAGCLEMWELQTPRTDRACNKPVQGFALPSLLENEWRNAAHLYRGYDVAWSKLARTAAALSTCILLANLSNLAGVIAYSDKGISPDNWHHLDPWPCEICCAQITTGTGFLRVLRVSSQCLWPHGQRRGSVAARLLGLRVRIPPGAWMFLSCEFCVLSGRGLFHGLITCPEESYWMWCDVCVCVWSVNLNDGKV